MNKNKKIAFVYFSFLPTIGGAEKALATFALWLKKHGYEVYVLTTKSYNLEYYPNLYKYRKILNINILRFDYIWPLNKLWKYLFLSIELIKFLTKNKFDILIIFSSIPSFFVLIPLIIGKARKSYIIYRPMFNPHRINLVDSKIYKALGLFWDYYIFPKLLRFADVILVLTHIEMYFISTLVKSFKRIYVVPDPIIINNFSSINIHTIKNKYNLNNCSYIILTVGRIIKYKGIHYLINALPLIINKLKSSVCFVIVGPKTKYVYKIIEIASEKDIKDNIKIIGSVPPEDLVGLYRLADSVAVLSMYETLSRVAIEALAFGKPLIISKYVPIAPLIKAFRAGIVVDPENIDELVDSIINILKNDRIKRNISRNSIIIYKKIFNYKNILNYFKKIITQ